MPKLTKEDEAVASNYEAAKPRQTGNVHERMKYVVETLRKIREAQNGGFGGAFDSKYMDLAMGIFDLETEVKYFRPVKPSYGSRIPHRGAFGAIQRAGKRH